MTVRHAVMTMMAMTTTACFAFAEGATKSIRFNSGASSAKISGKIAGYDVNKYKLDAASGQAVSVLFTADKNACYFNWIAPGANEATHFGERDGNEFSGNLTKSGTHVIEVYMMRSLARKGAVCKYSFTVEISGSRQSSQSTSPGTPSKDAQVCLAAVSRETNNGDVVLLSEENSEANNLVMIGVGPQRAPWKCLIKDGVVAEIMSMTDEGSL